MNADERGWEGASPGGPGSHSGQETKLLPYGERPAGQEASSCRTGRGRGAGGGHFEWIPRVARDDMWVAGYGDPALQNSGQETKLLPNGEGPGVSP